MLKEYAKKRDFKKTSEPKPKAAKSQPDSQIFVIQKHDATHLHYDLRLEINGVLKSWAIPKEPPVIPGIKRLAIETEDHPLEYASFEGTIPKGQYGAGTVSIWDKGELKVEKSGGSEILFELSGSRMKGSYALVKTGFGAQKNSWLFFKLR